MPELLMLNNSKNTLFVPKIGEGGYTLIEAVIAMVIMTIGMMAVSTSVTYALQTNYFSRNTTESKMLMSEMIEQIETLRNTGQLTFDQIANTGEVINPSLPAAQFAGFPTGFMSIRQDAGADGIIGTMDEQIPSIPIDPATAQYSRKVIITLLPVNPNIPNSPTNPNIKKVEVTLMYPGFNQGVRTISMTIYVTNQGN